MIQAIYLMSHTGLPIVTVFKNPDDEDETRSTLFSGILTAIQSALEEIDVGTPKFVGTQKFEIFLELSDKVAIAIIRDVKSEISREVLHELVADLQTRLFAKYPDLSDFNSLSTKEVKNLKKFLVQSLKQIDKEILKTKATRIMSDSIW